MPDPVNANSRPGDLILDRYLSDVSPEVREEARRKLYGFVGVLLRIAIRLEKEKRAAGEWRDSDGRPKIQP